MNKFLTKALTSINVANLLTEQQLVEIGNDVDLGYKEDMQSRSEWESRQDEYIKLALQVMETKNSPWANAANIKYPLLTTATMQFGARAYPGLVTSPSIVKGRVTGFDITGEKAKSAERVGKHMSYQLIEEMDDWEAGMDKLCISLPILGSMFKKTYFSPSKNKNISELVYPKNLVVNYWSKSLLDAPRITHVLSLSDNDIYERVAAGLFADQDYVKEPAKPNETSDQVHGMSQPSIDTAPHEFLEQHTWLDLDEDGYKEPYIVTYGDGKVARIVAGFEEEGITYTDRVVRIERIEYFTKYGFIPNPDGSFYDIGFGLLLGPINDTINTTINQLLDAGTLANRQGGFLGRGLKLKGGVYAFKPGEWKQTLSSGDDLRKNIFPLPVKDPSGVLFSLLGLMIDAGKELSNTVPMLMGQNPGQNQPATTSMAVIEQGLKVFSSIFKRMHRSLKQELKKLKRLNRIYLPPESYFNVLDMKMGEEGAEKIFQRDYATDTTDVQPYSDPNIVAEVQRMIKAQQVAEMMQQGLLPNPQAGAKLILESMDLPNIEELLTPPQQEQPFEQQMEIEKLEVEKEIEGEKLQLQRERLELDQIIARDKTELNETVMMLNLAKAEAAEKGTQINAYKAEVDKMKAEKDSEKKEKMEGMKEEKADQRAKEMKPPVINVEAPIVNVDRVSSAKVTRGKDGKLDGATFS